MLQAIRFTFFVVSLVLCGSLHAAGEASEASRYVTHGITVSGAVRHPLALSVEDLRQFPAHQAVDMALPGGAETNAGKQSIFRGVRLRSILERAEIDSPARNDLKKMVIIAAASDGYKVVFSWSEVFNSPIGEGVVVFFEKNGQPLPDEQGRIAMISGKDLHTGLRHVKWLQAIEVRKVVE